MCAKPRCVYSRKKLSVDKLAAVSDQQLKGEYVCGAPFFPGGHPLAEVAVVRRSQKCQSAIEVPYFTSRIGFPSCCYDCGSVQHLLEDTDTYVASLKRSYSIVSPMCRLCRDKGLEASVRSSIKAGQQKWAEK